MSNPRKHFPLRIDPKLFEAIQRMADQEMRSVNAQIEYMLNESVRRRTRTQPEEPPTTPSP